MYIEVVAKHILFVKTRPFFVSWWSSELTQLVKDARSAKRENSWCPSTKA